jgi:prophage antirepressor-like protein
MEETTASAITTFKFAGHEPVRTSIIEGKIWFVAQDVAQVLGIPHWKTQVARLQDWQAPDGYIDALIELERVASIVEVTP